MKESVLYAFHAVSEVLENSLDLDEILYAVLAAVTAGESFGFNRAFVLLHDEDRHELRGYFGMGPRTKEEAARVWNELASRGITLKEIISSYSPKNFAREKAKFQDIISQLRCPTAGERANPRIRQMAEHPGHAFIERAENNPSLCIFPILGVDEIAVVPLAVREQLVGVIIADNFVTNRKIHQEDLIALDTFASQASLAISRARLFKGLQEKIKELEDAQRKLIDIHQQLVQLEKRAAVGELVNHLAHEFKNPIVVIGGIAQVLAQEIPRDDPRFLYVKTIIDEVTKLDRLLKETVQGIRLQSNKEFEELNINQILRDKIESLSGYFAASNVEVRVEFDDRIPTMMLPRKSIEAICEYMIGNAVEAMPEGGKLTVSTKLEDGKVVLEFSDTGVGIPENIIDHIFDPYFTTKPGGTGLGLHNVKQILEALGGSIEVHSKVGEGTTFKLYLPLRTHVIEI